MATTETIHIAREYKLTITPDASASGNVVRLNSGSEPTNFQTIVASTPIVLGPFNDERDYRIHLTAGTCTTLISFDGTDDAELADYVRNDQPETNVPSPTALEEDDLKDAIDGILAILVAKGLMEAEE